VRTSTTDGPAWGPIGQEVFERTYARDVRDSPAGAQRKETWSETAARVAAGNVALGHAVPNAAAAREEAELRKAIEQMELLPGGRHLRMCGVPGRQFLFNCHHAGWTSDPADHACFTFATLMEGGGVGANYTQAPAYMPKTPVRARFDTPPWDADVVTVGDSRGGWVHALRHLINTAMDPGAPKTVWYDTSRVRAAGEPLVQFGGVSSGPGTLVTMLEAVASILTAKCGRILSRTDLMDIDHAIASCVIAGNVRRSARMSIVRWDDAEISDFIGLKRSGGHWTTNISVELDAAFFRAPAVVRSRVLEAVAEGMAANGEPGIYNSALASLGEPGPVHATNPCGEIPLAEWEPCNLASVNLTACESAAHAEHLFKMAARFLVRALRTPDVADGRQRRVLQANSRIGVGFMGLADYYAARGTLFADIAHRAPGDFIRWRSAVVAAARDEAHNNGLRAPVKYTCVAPTGTISLLPGSSPGAQPHFAKHYIRRVRYAASSGIRDKLAAAQLEDDEVSADTVVASFACREPRAREDISDISLRDQLNVLKAVQSAWADNAVSYTARIPPGTSADTILQLLYEFAPSLKGLTMFPEMSFAQQPVERISAAEYRRLSSQWSDAPAAVQIDSVGDTSCEGGGCDI